MRRGLVPLESPMDSCMATGLAIVPGVSLPTVDLHQILVYLMVGALGIGGWVPLPSLRRVPLGTKAEQTVLPPGYNVYQGTVLKGSRSVLAFLGAELLW